MAGGVHGREVCMAGACLAGGMHGRKNGNSSGRYTGMHSCNTLF